MSLDRRTFLHRRRRRRGRLARPRRVRRPAADRRGREGVHRRPRREAAAARRSPPNIAWWNANISGKDEDFKQKEEAQNKIDAALADTNAVRRAEGAQGRRKDEIDDPILARQIDVLYLQYLEKQVDPALLKKITAKANAVEQTFNVFRAKVDGKEMTDSEVRKVLKNSTDSERRQEVWEASKGVGRDGRGGPEGAGQAAQRGGDASSASRTSTRCMLHLNEQDGDELIKLFDELDELTREPFTTAKAEIDARLAKKLRHEGRRADAVALPRPVLPGVAGGLRRRPRRAVSPRPTSSSCAATSTPASACRSTT